MADIEDLKRQRKILRQAFTRILNYCNANKENAEQVHARAVKADELFQKYEGIQDQIDDLVDEHAVAAEQLYRADVEESYYTIKALDYRWQAPVSTPSVQQTPTQDNSHVAEAIQALVQHQTSMGTLLERFVENATGAASSTLNENAIQALVQHQTSMGTLLERFVENASGAASSTLNEHAVQQATTFQLPRIQLPDFDGRLLDWVRFKDLFEALVHNRENLANVQKLEYLHSKLKGEALMTIKHLSPTNDNYTVAWELLKNKYNNTEKIKSAYMELIFDQPPMKSSSLVETKRLYNSINEGFYALKTMDTSVEQWSSVLLFSIEKKLDSNTAMLWYREKKPDEVTNFNHILKFLEKRIFELESIHSSHQHTKEQTRRTQSRTYTSLMRTCPACSNNHQLYQCEEFKKMKVEDRRKLIQKHGLCFNCMQDNHRVDKCRASSCKICNKRHNTLLHLSFGRESAIATSSNHPEANSVIHHDANDSDDCTGIVSTNVTQRNEHVFVILPTAIITVVNDRGAERQYRALLDSGSQGTLITEACVQQMGLKKHYDRTVIYGVGSNNGNQTRGKVQLQIKAGNRDEFIVAQALGLMHKT